MTAKEYLLHIRTLRRRCESLENQLEELRSKAEGVKAITYDQDRVQTSPENRLEIIMIRIVDLEHKYITTLANCHAAIQIREKQIAGLDNQLFAEVLTLRYIDNRTFDDIAAIIQQKYPNKVYRNDYIRHVHGWALKAFENKYKTSLKKKRNDT